MPKPNTDVHGMSWHFIAWAVIVAIASFALAYSLVKTLVPLDQAWFLLALIAFVAALPVAPYITEVSALGITAKLRHEVRRAEEAVVQLRLLAKTVASEFLSEMAGAYYLESRTVSDRLASRDKVLSNLRELGIPDEEIAEVDRIPRIWIAFYIHDGLQKLAWKLVAPERQSEFMSIFHSARDQGKLEPATPDSLRRILKDFGALDETVEGWLCGYERFLKGGDLERRRELALILEQPQG